MRIAFVLNPSNFMTDTSRELRKRGHEVGIYPSEGRAMKMNVRSVVAFGLWQWQKMKKFDLIINSHYPPGNPFVRSSPEIRHWCGPEIYYPELCDPLLKKPGYYCTPDIADGLHKDSVLLPRAMNSIRFEGWKNERKWSGGPIRLAHLWRGGGSVGWYYFRRYTKRSDLLFEAVRILRGKGHQIDLMERPIDGRKMPEFLSSIDVLAEEFCHLSHGMTSVEALSVGTPVVGSYDPSLCECRESLDMMINVTPEPDAIADGILRAVEEKPSGNISRVKEYFSGKHAADVIEDTWRKLV